MGVVHVVVAQKVVEEKRERKKKGKGSDTEKMTGEKKE